LILLGCVFFTQLPTAFGQGATGAINGTVTDTSGAVIPQANVVLQSIATGVQRVAITNSTGTYAIPQVIPGTYMMLVSAQGFTTVKEQDFTLEVNQTQSHNFTLQVGTTKQEITVSAEAVHLESSTAELGTAVASREVNDLPLNGRNFTELLALTPGISPVNTAQSAGGGGVWGGNTIGTYSFPAVNGQCNRCNFFMLDGFNNAASYMSMVGTTPVIDGIQEFKVQSHNDSSAYGGALGALVNVATKSGTNEYHGDAWEFLRNNALDANNFFRNLSGLPTVPYKQNQFGATIGGPLVPGHFRGGAPKTWIFALYEGFRSVKSSTSLLNVPTPAQLGLGGQGYADLTGTGGQIYNPFSTAPDPLHPGEYTRDPFMCTASGAPEPATNNIQAPGTPCMKIPSSMIATSLVNYAAVGLPTPINTGAAGFNALDITPNRVRQDTVSLRFDHQFSERTSLWARYTGYSQPDAYSAGFPGATQSLFQHGYQLGAVLTHVFGGGSKVLTGGFGRNTMQTNSITLPGVSPDLWSTSGFSSSYVTGFSGVSALNPSTSIAGFSMRPGFNQQDTTMSDVYQWKGDFTWIHGRHTIQMGADFQTNNVFGPTEAVGDTFNTPQTSNLESPAGTGSAVASFLLGVPDSAQRRNFNLGSHGGWVDGWYAQDSWKATDKLTVNIGLRYDLTLWPIAGSGSPTNANRFVGDVDLETGVYYLTLLPPACNPTVYVGPCLPGGTMPAHTMVTPFANGKILHNTHDNLGPRLGLVYRLTSKTVIRAAAAKFFDNWGATEQVGSNIDASWPSLLQLMAQNLNYPTSANPLPSALYHDPFHLGSGFVPQPASNPFGQVAWQVDPLIQDAYSEQWNLGVQHPFGTSTILEADYVGSHSSRLNMGGLRGGAVTPGPGDISARSPFPYITPSFYDKSVGRASYNAFQFKLRRSTSKGLSYIISYTWSKAMNVGCDGYFGAEGCSVQNLYGLDSSKSVAGFDVPHVVVASWTYDLPFGKGRQFSSGSKVLNAIVGPWALNGIYSVRSGEPFTVGVSGDIANMGGGSERANIIGPAIPASRTWQEYLNTSSFQVPAAYTFGNSGRNAYRLTYAPNWDISLFRDFPLRISEAARLQFRAEFFNTFNNVVLGGCLDTTVQDPTFGTASCTRNTEREVQFALKLFF
jgi:hypothetical protein